MTKKNLVFILVVNLVIQCKISQQDPQIHNPEQEIDACHPNQKQLENPVFFIYSPYSPFHFGKKGFANDTLHFEVGINLENRNSGSYVFDRPNECTKIEWTAEPASWVESINTDNFNRSTITISDQAPNHHELIVKAKFTDYPEYGEFSQIVPIRYHDIMGYYLETAHLDCQTGEWVEPDQIVEMALHFDTFEINWWDDPNNIVQVLGNYTLSAPLHKDYYKAIELAYFVPDESHHCPDRVCYHYTFYVLGDANFDGSGSLQFLPDGSLILVDMWLTYASPQFHGNPDSLNPYGLRDKRCGHKFIKVQ